MQKDSRTINMPSATRLEVIFNINDELKIINRATGISNKTNIYTEILLFPVIAADNFLNQIPFKVIYCRATTESAPGAFFGFLQNRLQIFKFISFWTSHILLL